MKKLLIFCVIFGILAVVSTSVLIQLQKRKAAPLGQPTSVSNGDNHDSFHVNSQSNNLTANDTSKEKTLDLWGTFNQNDLIVKEVPLEYRTVSGEVTCFQIEGLKDKAVENKINQSIQQKAKLAVDEILKEPQYHQLDSTYYIYGNFANIISVTFNVYGTDDNQQYKNIQYYMNYELVNGNELKFEDVFSKDTDLELIGKLAMSRNIAGFERGTMDDVYSEIHFDEIKGTWMARHQYFDDETQMVKDEIVEYVLPYSEYEIDKKVKHFLKQEDKKFYFSPNEISFRMDDTYCHLYFEDIADHVVIYDKFLTNESIFERDDIGPKGVVTCSAEELDRMGKLKETKFVSDNFFYDISFNRFSALTGVTSQYEESYDLYSKPFKEKVRLMAFDEAKKIVRKYQKIAEENPQKAYFLLIEPNGNTCEKENMPTNLLIIANDIAIYECDISQKEEVWSKLLSAFRYYNLMMYGSTMSYLTWSEEGLNLVSQNERTASYFDLLTGKQLEGIQDVFINQENYLAILQAHLAERLKTYYSEFELGGFRLDFSGFIAENSINPLYGNLVLPYEEFQNELKLVSFNSTLLPSSEKMISIDMLQDFNDDELEIAYNEPFARHGHDFKTEKLKNYFCIWSWYQPIPGKVVAMEELTEIEKENVNLIKQEMQERKNLNR